MDGCLRVHMLRLSRPPTTRPSLPSTRGTEGATSALVYSARGDRLAAVSVRALEVRHEEIDGLVGLRDEHAAHLDVRAERIAGKTNEICTAAAD